MPINASIPLGVNALQLPMPDPNQGLNSLARVMQIKGAMQEGDMNALKMDEYKRNIEDTNALRSALSAPDADPYKVLLQRGRVKEAGDFLKSQNEAKNADATRQKTELEVALKKAEHAASLFSLAKDPATYGVVRSLMKQQLGQDLPEQYDPNFVQGQMALGQTITQRLADLRKQQENQLKAVNEPFTVGANGQPVPNQPVQNFQLGKARAGATNISVNTEKSYAGNMAEGLAKQDLSLLDAARTAPERIANAQRVKQILDTQPTITGSGAETRLALSKALSTAGLIDGQAVKSTEDLASLLASSTLDAIKTSGLGSGQGFTDKDRAFLERAKSGNIEINGGTIRTLADLNEKAARASIDAGARVAGRLKGNPTMGSVGQDFNFAQPPEYKGPSVVRKPPAAAGSAPSGVRFLGFEEKK